MSIDAGMIKSIVLQLIGGSPLKGASKHLIENLHAAHKIGAGLGSSIPGIGSISSITDVLQNPISSSVTGLTSSITTAVSGLGSFPTLSSQLNGALTHVSDLHTLADKLSGVTIPDVGDFGLHDAIQLASSSVSGASLATLTAPLNQSTLLSTFSTQVTTLVAQVHASTITESAAVTALQPYIDQVQGVVTTTQTAFTSANAASTIDSHLNQAISHLADANAPAEVKSLITSIIQPSKLAAIQTAVGG